MKRYQLRRETKRNTLIFWKYATPVIFINCMAIIGMIISMFQR